jgi:hypothetical protein
VCYCYYISYNIHMLQMFILLHVSTVDRTSTVIPVYSAAAVTAIHHHLPCSTVTHTHY